MFVKQLMIDISKNAFIKIKNFSTILIFNFEILLSS